MEEKLFNVPIELFSLEKIKINKQKVCEVDCLITDMRGDKNIVYCMRIKPNYQCTESLQKKLDELKPYLCDIHHINKNKRDKVNVTGIEMNGTGEKATFKIHGAQLSDSEQSMRFATCKVHYEGGYYGFENEVTDIIEDLQEMAHGYLFEGKRAEITLGLTSAEEVEEEGEEIEEVEIEEVEE